MHRPKHAPALLAALAAALLLAACAQTSVKHLNRNAWATDTDLSLTMQFWRFDYRIKAQGNQFAVRGTARPETAALPPTARWIEDLWLAAYLCDASGAVLAQDLRVADPGPLAPGVGLPFAFTLHPDALPPAGELYITFGYRMKLVPEGPEEDKPARQFSPAEVFFASEGAITRF
ncbi:hypothetical protein [Desulfocurvus vexinensis]|uniref:hypothetical protein n=1 Tax=Desulfocurvus vexinensis TaxID=399548 RepID=UPI0004B9FF34|nr:hypothetical protein [Desulfocurvus vexinensis]